MTTCSENSPSDTSESQAVTDQGRFGIRRQLGAVWRMQPKRLASLLARTYNDWSADGASRLGAALAYYTLFSVAPLLIVITGVVGFFVGRAAARSQIEPWLERFLSPEGARAADLMLKQHVTATGGVVATIIGILALFMATSAFVNELRQSLNLVWRVQTPPSSAPGVLGTLQTMITDRIYDFLLAVGAGLLVILSLAVNIVASVADVHFRGWLPIPAMLVHGIDFALTLVLMAVVFTLVYKTIPDAYVAWGDAFVGALATAVLFSIGGFLLSMFVGRTGASPYGTAASVLALLVWVYYSAQVFFFGAELTRIFATTRGGGIVATHRSLRDPLRRPTAPAGRPR
jgi:membrane protein